MNPVQIDPCAIHLRQSCPGQGLPIVLITAGFSQEANKHVSDTVLLLESKQRFNFVQPIYDQQIKAMQDSAVLKDKETNTQENECLVYSMVANAIAQMLISMQDIEHTSIRIIAKSAGAAVCMLLPKKIKVHAIYMLAPAPMTCNIPRRDIPVFLGWSRNDPKISYEKHFENTIKYLSSHSYIIEATMTGAERTHDFTDEFLSFIQSRLF